VAVPAPSSPQATGAPAAGLVITCEHGGNRIPAAYRDLFASQSALLASHRGFDDGALLMARSLAEAFSAPLLSAGISRLLVDLNRSPGHPKLHHPLLRDTPAPLRRRVLARYCAPYRRRAEALMSKAIAEHGRVIHVASHSFTPVLDGSVRRTDIGLLYDPARPAEALLCAGWKHALGIHAPALIVRRNYPYRGSGDGLTTALRRCFPVGDYVGVELELNQKLVSSSGEGWAALRAQVVASLREALAALGAAGA